MTIAALGAVAARLGGERLYRVRNIGTYFYLAALTNEFRSEKIGRRSNGSGHSPEECPFRIME